MKKYLKVLLQKDRYGDPFWFGPALLILIACVVSMGIQGMIDFQPITQVIK